MKTPGLLAARVASIILLVLAVPILRGQDMVKVSPKNCKVLLNNEQVRVVRCVIKPQETLPMHSHPRNVWIPAVSAKLRITPSDGQPGEHEVKAGQVYWSEPVTHSIENLGTTEYRSLIVELKKETPSPAKQ
jgi:quercetin dioxygenase-like cupin family protein